MNIRNICFCKYWHKPSKLFAHLINGFELFWMKVLENVFLCWKSNIRRHIYDDFRFDSCGKQIRIIDIYKRSLLHNSNLLRGSFSEKSNKCALLQMGIVFVNLYGNCRETIERFLSTPWYTGEHQSLLLQ